MFEVIVTVDEGPGGTAGASEDDRCVAQNAVHLCMCGVWGVWGAVCWCVRVVCGCDEGFIGQYVLMWLMESCFKCEGSCVSVCGSTKNLKLVF